MSEAISNINSHLEHIQGEFYWLHQQDSPEIKIALKQAETAFNELRSNELTKLFEAINKD